MRQRLADELGTLHQINRRRIPCCKLMPPSITVLDTFPSCFILAVVRCLPHRNASDLLLRQCPTRVLPLLLSTRHHLLHLLHFLYLNIFPILLCLLVAD